MFGRLHCTTFAECNKYVYIFQICTQWACYFFERFFYLFLSNANSCFASAASVHITKQHRRCGGSAKAEETYEAKSWTRARGVLSNVFIDFSCLGYNESSIAED